MSFPPVLFCLRKKQLFIFMHHLLKLFLLHCVGTRECCKPDSISWYVKTYPANKADSDSDPCQDCHHQYCWGMLLLLTAPAQVLKPHGHNTLKQLHPPGCQDAELNPLSSPLPLTLLDLAPSTPGLWAIFPVSIFHSHYTLIFSACKKAKCIIAFYHNTKVRLFWFICKFYTQWIN